MMTRRNYFVTGTGLCLHCLKRCKAELSYSYVHLPISQRSPEKPDAHRHSYDPGKLLHVPPLLHSMESSTHSSISGKEIPS